MRCDVRAWLNASLLLAGEQEWHFLGEKAFLIFAVDIGSGGNCLHHERLGVGVILTVGVVVVDVESHLQQVLFASIVDFESWSFGVDGESGWRHSHKLDFESEVEWGHAGKGFLDFFVGDLIRHHVGRNVFDGEERVVLNLPADGHGVVDPGGNASDGLAAVVAFHGIESRAYFFGGEFLGLVVVFDARVEAQCCGAENQCAD